MIPKKTKRKFLESNQVPKGTFPRDSKKIRMIDEEECSPPSGMRKIHRYASKFGRPYASLNYHKISRWLRNQVGNPWSDVYSKLCDHADYRTYEGRELREWLPVETNCHIENGKVFENSDGDRQCYGFYVHPATGLLQYEPEPWRVRKRKRKKDAQKIFELNGFQYYRHTDGLWYRVEMKEVPFVKPCWLYNWDIVDDVFVPRPPTHGYYTSLPKHYGRSPNGGIWFCINKKSANSREIAGIKEKYELH